eukprot:Tbor_TRINITY_DN4611_c0_g1::TRINITY_DN4611_c0_g1_i2::g.14946::m.14946/K10950/ERO1L; ERO1-like protein alpha
MSGILLIVSIVVFVGSGARATQTVETNIVRNGSPFLSNDFDYCYYNATGVNENSENVRRLLDRIRTRPFFRYVRINTQKSCPYWAASVLCLSEQNPCEVCTCDAKDVPYKLLDESADIDANNVQIPVPSQYNDAIDRSPLSGKKGNLRQNFFKFSKNDLGEFVDLLRNPESLTGYSGDKAHRIWNAIYRENCFTTSESNQCSEKLFFYRLISGLHTSISAHLSANYYLQKEDPNVVENAGDENPLKNYLPECTEMQRRVHDHPERRENLYVLYQFVLRALSKSEKQYTGNLSIYESGVPEEDHILKEEIKDLFTQELLCKKTFDDIKFLESPTTKLLLPRMVQMMTNITTLMNCLTCEKCRLWGKLQTHGVATAFKVILSHEPNLRRCEMVALLNLARQLAMSIHYINKVCPNQMQEGNKSQVDTFPSPEILPNPLNESHVDEL